MQGQLSALTKAYGSAFGFMSGNRYDKRKYLGKGDSLPNPAQFDLYQSLQYIELHHRLAPTPKTLSLLIHKS